MDKNPTDRGRNAVKRSLVVEAHGGPLAVVIAGANVHDAKLLKRHIASHRGAQAQIDATQETAPVFEQGL